MIGMEMGKIVVFDFKMMDCRKCLFFNDYECNKNFDGSLKVMEFVLVFDMVKFLRDRGFKIFIIIMDDDFIIIFRMWNNIDFNIMKISDKNYVWKNMLNVLYKF